MTVLFKNQCYKHVQRERERVTERETEREREREGERFVLFDFRVHREKMHTLNTEWD